jgi:2-polyprenyl-6-methoxyphenol hydroxylase-like FAD-dependent oxidoreductase
MRVAVVGSGPAGFYAAGQLLSGGDGSVDMLDRLPTPQGRGRPAGRPRVKLTGCVRWSRSQRNKEESKWPGSTLQSSARVPRG